MRTKQITIIEIIKQLMRIRKRLPSQLASDIRVNHATVIRWLSGEYVPSVQSCTKLAKYGGIPIENLLTAGGHLSEIEGDRAAYWPQFREYAKQKYPNELDEDIIVMIETLIKRRKMHTGEKEL